MRRSASLGYFACRMFGRKMDSEEVPMSKVVAWEFVSLDGVVHSPEKWHFPYLNDQMAETVC